MICNEIQEDIAKIVPFIASFYIKGHYISIRNAVYRASEKLKSINYQAGDMMMTAIAVVAILMKIL